MPSTLNEFLEKAMNETKLDEAQEDGFNMYKDGALKLSTAFAQFSKLYMKSMSMLIKYKNVETNSSAFKKARDDIADAYAHMDSAISRHTKYVK